MILGSMNPMRLSVVMILQLFLSTIEIFDPFAISRARSLSPDRKMEIEVHGHKALIDAEIPENPVAHERPLDKGERIEAILLPTGPHPLEAIQHGEIGIYRVSLGRRGDRGGLNSG
ncbi:MAG: hypothetical protein C5B49_13130 [Bdellovibrio sp.]|nr:MAG: hypothetical protein C5B49_13130 [Bdellovibrio sp.]